MRGYFALIGLFSVLVGCATHHEQQTADSCSPALSLSLQDIVETNGYQVALFEIKNAGDMDMWYSADSSCDYPYCAVQHRMATGWEGSIDDTSWCGMGEIRCRIPARSSKIIRFGFGAQAEHPKPFRIGVRFSAYESPNPSTPNPLYWSDTVFP